MDRRAPAPVLVPYVAWYWSVRWDLRGRPAHRQVTLPHASSHLIVEDGAAWLHGPPHRRFERVLAGEGRVVGVRFTAGGLAAVLGRPLVGGPVPASTLAGLDGDELAAAITGSVDVDDAAKILDRTLTAVMPKDVDPAVETVENAVRIVEQDRSVLRVTDLADRLGLATRTLQRFFAAYVGVSPGWVIRRCRLQEVALRATEGRHVDWVRLAADLGYYDQAHLVRDFTTAIGVPPARYAGTRPDNDSTVT
ncbi:helix-turn-helix domain-containing protein [Dactylosporangium fulvum]